MTPIEKPNQSVPRKLMKKGINFKQTGKKKMLLIHPETLSAYLESLPKGANGWVAFDFLELAEPDRLNHFAKCIPLVPLEEKSRA